MMNNLAAKATGKDGAKSAFADCLERAACEGRLRAVIAREFIRRADYAQADI
jgi:hypothetical protein